MVHETKFKSQYLGGRTTLKPVLYDENYSKITLTYGGYKIFIDEETLWEINTPSPLKFRQVLKEWLLEHAFYSVEEFSLIKDYDETNLLWHLALDFTSLFNFPSPLIIKQTTFNDTSNWGGFFTQTIRLYFAI